MCSIRYPGVSMSKSRPTQHHTLTDIFNNRVESLEEACPFERPE